jgi:hypothetical protein
MANTADVAVTQNFTASSIAALASVSALGYKSYTAIISQTGTAAPVATVLQNTIGGTFTWGYTSVGVYTVTSSSSGFTANKTIVFTNDSDRLHGVGWIANSNSLVTITAAQDSGIATCAFEVRVYS